MPYTTPVTDFRFILENVVDFKAVAATDRFSEATPDLVDAILTEAAKLPSMSNTTTPTVSVTCKKRAEVNLNCRFVISLH